jgi:Ser/Thr protein kinase RdoA (MazF antagonist)
VGGELLASLPEPGEVRRVAGWEWLALSVLAGRSAYVELHELRPPTRARAHLLAAADWLGRFHRRTRRAGTWRPPVWEDLAPPGAAAGAPGWYRRLAARAEGRPLPLAAAHGDYWARNVLVRDGVVTAVVDWEAWRETAPPWHDLFDFALAYGLAAPRRGGDDVGAFRHAFLDDTALARAIAAGFARHAELAGIEADLLGPLLRADLLRRAREAGKRAPGGGGGGALERKGGGFWLACEGLLAARRSACSG